jgi:importin-7
MWLTLVMLQAQKFGGDQHLDLSDDELGEDSVLLESPLDKLEPYQIFRSALMSELPFPS